MMQVELKKQRHHSLTGRVVPEVMRQAFKNVKRNRGAGRILYIHVQSGTSYSFPGIVVQGILASAGVDKVSIKMYEKNLAGNLAHLMDELKTGTYQPKPLRRKYIDKGGGKTRPLGIPAVKDRIAHEVIRVIINPIFDQLFHNNSHGFRRGKSCQTAIKQLLEFFHQGYNIVVDADIKGFFDNIPHELIMALVEREISDSKTLNTIQKFLRAGVIEDGKFIATLKGTPQGGVISPLLANIVLNHLDWTLDSYGYKFVRYADDFVVLAKSRVRAEEAASLDCVPRSPWRKGHFPASPVALKMTLDYNSVLKRQKLSLLNRDLSSLVTSSHQIVSKCGKKRNKDLRKKLEILLKGTTILIKKSFLN
jgi:RNA-directed DNA polymerase